MNSSSKYPWVFGIVIGALIVSFCVVLGVKHHLAAKLDERKKSMEEKGETLDIALLMPSRGQRDFQQAKGFLDSCKEFDTLVKQQSIYRLKPVEYSKSSRGSIFHLGQPSVTAFRGAELPPVEISWDEAEKTYSPLRPIFIRMLEAARKCTDNLGFDYEKGVAMPAPGLSESLKA